MESFETLSFFRGVSTRYSAQHPTVHNTRRDRKPKDSPIEFHEFADEWFCSRFGVRYRSQAVFLTSMKRRAVAFAATPAHVMRIIPLSVYRYCWSPHAVDLLFAARRLRGSGRAAIEGHLESLQYREDSLSEAHAAGNEVMLFCESYIAIPVHLTRDDLSETCGPSILLDSFSMDVD